MKKAILVILVFIVGFIIGQAIHIYTFDNSGRLRLNTVTGDIVTVGDVLRKQING